MSSTNVKLLRKLGEPETMFAIGNISTTASYMVKSKINIYENISAFRQAITEWQKRDQFLQVRIHKSQNDGEYYFEQMSEEEFVSKQDVEFLKLKEGISGELESEIWRGLLELEPTILFDSFNNTLWRIRFLGLTPFSSGEFRYFVIFTFHHATSEGRGSIRVLQELFAVFESILSGKFTAQTSVEITPSLDSLVKEKLGKEFFREVIPNMAGHRQDDFYNKWVKPEDSLPRVPFNPDDSIVKLTGEKYMSFGEFFKKLEKVEQRIKPILIGADKYNRLLAKCKSNGAKFNGCLNLILTIALRNVLKKFGMNDREKITYILLMSQRNKFISDKDKNLSAMGYYITELPYSHAEESAEDELDEKRFWSLSKAETNTTQENLNSNKLYRVDLNTYGSDGMLFSHFTSSNIGLIPSSLTDEKLIELTERYIHFHLSGGILFMCGACSVSQQLSLAILYPSCLGREPIEFLAESINRIIDRLLGD